VAILTRGLLLALAIWCAADASAAAARQTAPAPQSTPIEAQSSATPATSAPSASATTAAAPHPALARAHRDIGSAVLAAQAAFDRGLVMLYAFNVGEARTAFRAAETADAQAVLPYVGEAVAETIDINRPTTPDGERRGAAAIARGRLAAARASAADRAIYDAVALRFQARGSQHARFASYFAALQAYSDAHPDDGMGATLAAYAGWNVTAPLTSGPAQELVPDARTIVADLDRALVLDPDDVGAHHLRIHFWETAEHPGRALSDAQYLAGLTYDPGESHLEHMAGHIYDRLGYYAQMIDVNKGACANDAVYFAHGSGDGQQYMRGYHDHDVDFVLYGLTTVGRNAEAQAFAAHESTLGEEHVALRVHDTRAVLRLLGDAVTPLRVIAEARAGDVDTARKDLAGLGGANEVDVAVATAALDRAAHDDGAAIAAYRKALAAAGDDLGDPKYHWYAPIAEGLGATLLEAHAPADAERVFRAELARYPNDPHLEFGLAQALADQGKDDRAARAAYAAQWQGKRPLTVADLG
jgi:hypothetical protein